MDRRREIQIKYNEEHNITPTSIQKSIRESLGYEEKFSLAPMVQEEEDEYGSPSELSTLIAGLEKEMYAAARELEFERAAQLRDRVKKLKEKDLELSA